MKKLTAILVLICFVTTALPVNLMALTCGADLNNDGFADAQNETATCINYPVHNGQGNADYCPIQAVNCELEPPIQPIKKCIDPGYDYVIATDRCEKVPVCPTGTSWDDQAKVCIASLPGGLSGTTSSPDCGPGQFHPATGVCTADYTLSEECADGTYNPTTGLCDLDVFNCPLGNYTCFDAGGSIPQCSPNPCVDTQAIQNEVIQPPPDDSWLQNDGQVDADGNCLGSLYIFSGKSARCRPSGYQVGLLNNCCDSSDTITDSKTGNKYSSYTSALKTTYQMSKTAYYSYQIGTGAMTASTTASGAVTVTSTATGATVTTTAAGSQIGTGVMAAQGATSSGAGVAGATQAGLQGYTSALLNPTTIAIAVGMMVAMKVLFGNGCDENDVQAAIFNESGYCHYLGDICVKKFKFIGCVQRAKRFCCFNSKMGRIVAEQGRPQLKSFGPSGGWGTPKNPNCRGFTPEEFQQLDFSKIDLTEYFGDIMDGMNQNVQDAQQRIQQGIQNHYQGTQQ